MARTPQQDLERELRDPEFARLYHAEQRKSEMAIALENKTVYQCILCRMVLLVPLELAGKELLQVIDLAEIEKEGR